MNRGHVLTTLAMLAWSAAASAAPGDPPDPNAPTDAPATTKPAKKPISKRKPKPHKAAPTAHTDVVVPVDHTAPPSGGAAGRGQAPSVGVAPAPVVVQPVVVERVDTTPAPSPVVTDAPPVVVEPALEPEHLHSWYIRVGGAYLKPLSSSSPVVLDGVTGAASLAINNGPIKGSGSAVEPAFLFAAIAGYRLPWLHQKLSIETVLGLPFTVKFQATGTLANQSIAPVALGIPTGVPALGSNLGEATATPPVFTLVYWPYQLGPVKPLVGAGFTILFPSDEKITNPILTAVSQPSFKVNPAPGLVLQAGIDIKLYKRWYARLDLKFMALLEAKAVVSNIYIKTPGLPLFGDTEVGTTKANVYVNPLIIEGGIGFDFF